MPRCGLQMGNGKVSMRPAKNAYFSVSLGTFPARRPTSFHIAHSCKSSQVKCNVRPQFMIRNYPISNNWKKNPLWFGNMGTRLLVLASRACLFLYSHRMWDGHGYCRLRRRKPRDRRNGSPSSHVAASWGNRPLETERYWRCASGSCHGKHPGGQCTTTWKRKRLTW